MGQNKNRDNTNTKEKKQNRVSAGPNTKSAGRDTKNGPGGFCRSRPLRASGRCLCVFCMYVYVHGIVCYAPGVNVFVYVVVVLGCFRCFGCFDG